MMRRPSTSMLVIITIVFTSGGILADRDEGHAGNCPQSVLQLIEVGLGLGRREPMLTHSWIDGQHLLITKSRVGIQRVQRRTHQQSSQDEQHTTGAHLRTDDELMPEGAILFPANHLQRGQQSKKERCDKTHRGGE